MCQIIISISGTSELVQNNEMLRQTNMDKTERDEILAESLNDHDQSIEKHELQCLDNERKLKLENSNGDNLINVLSSSTSSSIEDIVYDDSLQGDSFESDRYIYIYLIKNLSSIFDQIVYVIFNKFNFSHIFLFPRDI